MVLQLLSQDNLYWYQQHRGVGTKFCYNCDTNVLAPVFGY